VDVMPEPAAVEEARLWQELRPRLDQVLNRLPDKYRVPVVLCELEGRPRKEVAQRLGIPEGTLSSRLATARRLLAKRLAGQGLTLSGGALAMALAQNAATANVPPTLLNSTIQAATMTAAGQAATAGVVSAKVAALTEGVVRAMFFTKLKIATAVLLLAGVPVLTLGLIASGPSDGANEIGGKAREGPAVAVGQKPTSKNADAPRGNAGPSIDELRGKWTGEKNGVKVDLTFNDKQARWQANWQVEFSRSVERQAPNQSPTTGVSIGADLKCLADLKGSRWNLYLPAYLGDNQLIKESARGGGKPVGEIQRGAAGTVQLRIIPTGYENVAQQDYDYPAVEGLILRRVPETPAQIGIQKVDDVWGEAVGGVRLGVRAAKKVWRSDETIDLPVQLINGTGGELV
jgi:hypothetical protein